MEEKVKEVLSSVLGIDTSQIDENASSETIEKWDSLRHMNLIVALEEELDTEIDDEDIPKMKSFSGIMAVLKQQD